MTPPLTPRPNPHLSDIELVDYADAVLPPARVGHLESCESYRAQAAMLGAMVREARDADVPEPSPLFWEHLGTRVRNAVQDAGVRPSRPRWHAPAWTAAAIVAFAVAAGIQTDAPFFTFISDPTTGSDAVPSAGSMPADAREAADLERREPADLESDDEWALVRDAAADLHWDAAHEAGLDARPGAAERVALELSADERQELAHLIAREMKSSGS